ncbi:hypothetical protein LCGC14_0734750 [marine sediment metagenome]|uniref:HNH nuclease domain-containing protein n=1 Tax=marine sediment metagenome TaxID=412755 RepID=A0A0F9TFV9_9ZZZZ
MGTMKNKRGLHNKNKFEALWPPRKDELKWLYHNQKWSMSKIGDYYNVSQSGISKVLKRLGIPSRGKGRLGSENGRYKDGTQSRMYRQMIEKDKCSTCGTIKRLVVHHKNCDHMDNRLQNLQILCESCHNRLHRKLWWAKRKASGQGHPAKRNQNGTFKKTGR